MHEIKFDGYRIQMRVSDGDVTLKTRKGLDWTGKFGAIAEAAAGLPDGIIDGEIVALDANGVPDFAALQAALSEGKTNELIFFAFDLLFDGDEDLRKRPLSERKRLLKRCSSTGMIGESSALSNISRRAATRCCARPASCRWKASSRRSSMRPINPAATAPGRRQNAAQGTKW